MRDRASVLSRATRQISIMKMVKHDHVVKLYEVLASRTKVSRRGTSPGLHCVAPVFLWYSFLCV